ncbi:MAG: amidohydrolase family protein [Planctomycetota bacterium]
MNEPSDHVRPPAVRTLHLAAAALDPGGVTHRPGAVLVDGGRAVAWGERDALRREHAGDASDAVVVDHGETLLMPGLVNAHAHFELGDIGPRPYTGSFTSWIRLLWEHRPKDAAAVGRAVWRAIAASVAAGVDAVGDIGGGRLGQDEAQAAWEQAGLRGVWFPELIGLSGAGVANELERLSELVASPARHATLTRGVSPHAPYSTGRTLYAAVTRASVEHGLPVTTHLAEMTEEHEFVAHAAGPFRDFLEELGVWRDEQAADYRDGSSPVRWMEPYLRATRWLVAHGNYVDDDDLALLADTGTSVAYCPVASAYFRHRGHRYRDMLDAGVNVCLGTDSIVCQPPNEPQPHGVLPQMRFLYRRDGTDPGVLFQMATANGRNALRLGDTVRTLSTVRFDARDPTEPLRQVLAGDAPSAGVVL